MGGPTVVAMDVGGSNLRYALVRRTSWERGTGHGVEIVRRDAIATGDSEGRDAVMGRIVRVTREATDWAPDGLTPLGVGMAMAGPIDPATGIMYRPPNLMSFDNFSPMEALQRELGVKAVCANDATLAALAEHRYGRHGDPSNLVYLTLSTGVGGGQVVNGELYTGQGGFAGEWGHMTLDPDGPPCNCGNLGCLESYCSGPGVARIARRLLDENDRPSLMREVPSPALADVAGLDAEAVNVAARLGDETALAVWEEAGRYLGMAVGNIMNAVDPDVIVIGGSVSKALDLMMPSARREMAWRAAMVPQRGGLPVVQARLGDDSALLGAAAMAFQTFG